MTTNKKWTVRVIVDGASKYENLIGNDVVKIIDYVCKKYEIQSTAIDYLSSEEVEIID